MAWKLSIDLSRPLVTSMGHHDPIDGFVTCKQLEATAAALGSVAGPSLSGAIADFAAMIDHEAIATTDPLGLGGLLVDVYRLAYVDAKSDLIWALLDAAVRGLRVYLSEPALRAPAHHRLAFRELGLALGLEAVSRIDPSVLVPQLDVMGQDQLAELAQCAALHAEIESFWLRRDHRRSPTWALHSDINDVMLATCLVPDGFMALGAPDQLSSMVAPAPSPAPP